MAIRSILTNSGIEILAKSQSEMGGQYWLGYFSLAYVPQEWKDSEDPVAASMTKLTSHGDIIYNVWQGDLLGNYAITSNYRQNVKTHYRYILDDNNVNNLVVWEQDPNYSVTIGSESPLNRQYIGKWIYAGTTGGTGGSLVESELPIPSPVYYFGDVAGNGSSKSTLMDMLTADGIYTPTIEVTTSSTSTIDVPRVSIDVRGFAKSASASEPTSAGTYFDTHPVPESSSDYSVWFSAESTQFDSTTGYANELHSLATISNYNRYHASSSENSLNYRSEIKADNISKSTKYFQISDFSVINSNEVVTSTGEKRIAATGIKVILSLNIAPSITEQGFETDGTYNPEQNLVLKSSYGSDPDGVANDLYETIHSSFKFNRAGIYAVKVRKAVINSENSLYASSITDKVVYEIDPDEEPVLFAVVDWDNTQIISETGDPTPEFEIEVSLNLAAYDDGLGDSSLIRDNIVFYNLYESDAIKFYKNQLLMNAQTLYSINTNSLEITALKRNVSAISSRLNSVTSILESARATTIGSGIGVYAGIDSNTGTMNLRAITGGNGIGVTTQGDGAILIETSGVVISQATNYSTTAQKSIALFQSQNELISTGDSITITDSKLYIDGQIDDSKYTDTGLLINGKNVTSNGLIETVVEKVETVTSVGTLDIDLVNDLGLSFYDLVRSIHWTMADCQASNYKVTIIRVDSASPTVIDNISAITTHDATSKTSGMLIEPMLMTDDFSAYDFKIRFEDLVTVTNIDIYAVYDRIDHAVIDRSFS